MPTWISMSLWAVGTIVAVFIIVLVVLVWVHRPTREDEQRYAELDESIYEE